MKSNMIELTETCLLKYYNNIKYPIFALIDVCKCFDLDKRNNVIRDTLKDELLKKGGVCYTPIKIYNKYNKELITINIKQLYEILFRSESEKGKKMRRIFMQIIEEKRLEYIEERDKPQPLRYVTEKPNKHRYGLYDGDQLVWSYKTYRDPEIRKKELVKTHKDKRLSRFKDYIVENGAKNLKVRSLSI